MKVVYGRIFRGWYWVLSVGETHAASTFYTRRRDAVRGFERFCARVRAM